MFEFAIALLDRNIRHLLLTHRWTEPIQLLDIKALQTNIRFMALGPAVSYKPPKQVEAEFEVQTLT
jgi:hypothetical protein